MNFKMKIPFFNKNKRTYSDCVEDVRESDSFYMETGHSGFTEEALSHPLVTQKTRDMITEAKTKLVGTDDILAYRSSIDEYGIPNTPFYAQQEPEEILKMTNEWVMDNIEKVNRDKSLDLSFPSFKESLDLEREDETLKEERLRNVYLKKRVRREMRKEEKEALRISKSDKKKNLFYKKLAEIRDLNHNPNKRYVEMALSIINKADIISRNNGSVLNFNIKYKSKGKHFLLKFIPQYIEHHYDDNDSYDTGFIGMEMESLNRMSRGVPSHRKEIHKGTFLINEIETEHCGLTLVNHELIESQSIMLNKAINKRLSHIKRHTLYEMFETLDMNKEKVVVKSDNKDYISK